MRIQPRLMLMVVAMVCQGAQAQTERTGSDTARVMQQAQQLQQITAEKTSLQAENEKLKMEIETLRSQVSKGQGDQAALQKRVQTAEAAVARAGGTAEANASALERSRVQIQELVVKFRETADNLKNIEIAKANTETELGTTQRGFTTCVDRNAGLYELNTEILTRMEDQGFWGSLTTREPFTRIARTRLENLIDDYRYRVDELRIDRQRAANPAPQSAVP